MRVAPQPTGSSMAAAPAVVAALQKLSISSNPDGADIEIDGAFVGNTPSVIDLGLGVHNVVIRKQGYKPWERKLRLVGVPCFQPRKHVVPPKAWQSWRIDN